MKMNDKPKTIGEINDEEVIDRIAARVHTFQAAQKPERLSELWAVGVIIVCATALVIFKDTIPPEWADIVKWLGVTYIGVRGGGKIVEKLNGRIKV